MISIIPPVTDIKLGLDAVPGAVIRVVDTSNGSLFKLRPKQVSATFEYSMLNLYLRKGDNPPSTKISFVFGL